jgi:hypothetical protein
VKNLTLLLTAAVLLAAGNSAYAQIVQNGNFQDPAAQLYANGEVEGTQIPDFTTTSGSIGLNGYGTGPGTSGTDFGGGGPYTPFEPGGYSQTNNPTVPVLAFIQYGSQALSQDITLQASTLYTLSFLYAPRGGDTGDTGSVVVDTGSTLGVPTVFSSGTLSPVAGSDFISYSETFLSGADVSSNTSITLNNTSETGDHTFDFANVSITAVVTPEPSTYLLLGLGGLGLILTRRLRNSQV